MVPIKLLIHQKTDNYSFYFRLLVKVHCKLTSLKLNKSLINLKNYVDSYFNIWMKLSKLFKINKMLNKKDKW